MSEVDMFMYKEIQRLKLELEAVKKERDKLNTDWCWCAHENGKLHSRLKEAVELLKEVIVDIEYCGSIVITDLKVKQFLAKLENKEKAQ